MVKHLELRAGEGAAWCEQHDKSQSISGNDNDSNTAGPDIEVPTLRNIAITLNLPLLDPLVVRFLFSSPLLNSVDIDSNTGAEYTTVDATDSVDNRFRALTDICELYSTIRTLCVDSVENHGTSFCGESESLTD